MNGAQTLQVCPGEPEARIAMSNSWPPVFKSTSTGVSVDREVALRGAHMGEYTSVNSKLPTQSDQREKPPHTHLLNRLFKRHTCLT